jgi:hypothetical protein
MLVYHKRINVVSLVWFMVFNATFNNISVISWRSVLLVEETGVFPHDNFSSVYWIFTKFGHMIPLWKGKNPIYFGVITIIPFDNLYRRAYFVMHTFLVFTFLLRGIMWPSLVKIRYTELKLLCRNLCGHTQSHNTGRLETGV